jgi:hypothetical protein
MQDLMNTESTDRSSALTAMQSLFSGFESRILRQRMLPHPSEGSLYDFDPNRISRRNYRRGDFSPSGKGDFIRRESVGLLHKPLLGTSIVKVCCVLEFRWPQTFDSGSLQDLVKWSLAPLRQDIYFIFGIAGVRPDHQLGHADETMRALAGGSNWRGCLVDFGDPGWAISSPTDGAILPSLFENLFDPEPAEQKIARVDSTLANAQELQEPGGFIIIDELSRRTSVGRDLVIDRAMQFAASTPGVDVKEVGGDLIIQRDRFENVRTG